MIYTYENTQGKKCYGIRWFISNNTSPVLLGKKMHFQFWILEMHFYEFSASKNDSDRRLGQPAIICSINSLNKDNFNLLFFLIYNTQFCIYNTQYYFVCYKFLKKKLRKKSPFVCYKGMCVINCVLCVKKFFLCVT